MSVIRNGDLWAIYDPFFNKWDVIRKDGSVVEMGLSTRAQAETFLAEAA